MHKTNFSPLNHLDCISRIFPVSGAVVVGAGMGEGVWFDLLRDTDSPVLLIEAEAGRASQLERDCADRVNWQVEQQVVSDRQSDSTFNLLSNSSESGLLPVEETTELWPNMKLKQQIACQTVTLVELIQQVDFTANWLIVDCLPALPIFQGAESVLSDVDVVIVRVLADQSLCATAQSARKDINEWLSDKGFTCMGLTPERHPALAHAVYVRDYVGMIQQQAADLDKVKDRAAQEESELQAQVHKLTEERNAQDKLATDRQQQIEQLTKSRNEQTKLVDERQAQIEKLFNSQNEQKKLNDAQVAEIGKLKTSLQEEKTRVAKLETQLSDTEQRQQMLNDELTKAETQIELIKDLMLSGKLSQ